MQLRRVVPSHFHALQVLGSVSYCLVDSSCQWCYRWAACLGTPSSLERGERTVLESASTAHHSELVYYNLSAAFSRILINNCKQWIASLSIVAVSYLVLKPIAHWHQYIYRMSTNTSLFWCCYSLQTQWLEIRLRQVRRYGGMWGLELQPSPSGRLDPVREFRKLCWNFELSHLY